MSKLTLDLHEIYNKKKEIDISLKSIIKDAIEKKIKTIIIIPGKGTGQLKKKVIRFLYSQDIKILIKRYEIDEKNFGKIVVHL